MDTKNCYSKNMVYFGVRTFSDYKDLIQKIVMPKNVAFFSAKFFCTKASRGYNNERHKDSKKVCKVPTKTKVKVWQLAVGKAKTKK